MYEQFFSLKGNPFDITPDPGFYFPSAQHKKALGYLRYGLSKGEGFVVVTGVPGIGKSLVIQTLIASLSASEYTIGYVVFTQVAEEDLLKMVVSALGLDANGLAGADLLIRLERELKRRAREGRRFLLVIDEVHNLGARSLEVLRMLTNFQVGKRPCLQCFLVGQEPFRTALSSADLTQLEQRVVAACHLRPLQPAEVMSYVQHRLQCVGWQDDPRLNPEVYPLIYEYSQGIPRRMHTLCDRLFLDAYLEEQHTITAARAAGVVDELRQETSPELPQNTVSGTEAESEEVPRRGNPSAGDVTTDSDTWAVIAGSNAGDSPPLSSARREPSGLAQSVGTDSTEQSLHDALETRPAGPLSTPTEDFPRFLPDISEVDESSRSGAAARNAAREVPAENSHIDEGRGNQRDSLMAREVGQVGATRTDVSQDGRRGRLWAALLTAVLIGVVIFVARSLGEYGVGPALARMQSAVAHWGTRLERSGGIETEGGPDTLLPTVAMPTTAVTANAAAPDSPDSIDGRLPPKTSTNATPEAVERSVGNRTTALRTAVPVAGVVTDPNGAAADKAPANADPTSGVADATEPGWSAGQVAPVRVAAPMAAAGTADDSAKGSEGKGWPAATPNLGFEPDALVVPTRTAAAHSAPLTPETGESSRSYESADDPFTDGQSRGIAAEQTLNGSTSSDAAGHDDPATFIAGVKGTQTSARRAAAVAVASTNSAPGTDLAQERGVAEPFGAVTAAQATQRPHPGVDDPDGLTAPPARPTPASRAPATDSAPGGEPAPETGHEGHAHVVVAAQATQRPHAGGDDPDGLTAPPAPPRPAPRAVVVAEQGALFSAEAASPAARVVETERRLARIDDPIVRVGAASRLVATRKEPGESASIQSAAVDDFHPPQPSRISPSSAEVSEFVSDYTEAFRTADVDALRLLFTPDCRHKEEPCAVAYVNEIEPYLRRSMTRSLELEGVEWVYGLDHVTGYGRFVVEFYNSQENAILTEAGKTTLVLVKEGTRIGISQISTDVDRREQRVWLTD